MYLHQPVQNKNSSKKHRIAIQDYEHESFRCSSLFSFPTMVPFSSHRAHTKLIWTREIEDLTREIEDLTMEIDYLTREIEDLFNWGNRRFH